MKNLLYSLWGVLRRPRKPVKAETRIELKPEPKLKRVRFMGIGITDALREGLRRQGFEEGGMDSPTVVIPSPVPSFVEELAKRYKTIVIVGPPGPWLENEILVNDLRTAGALGVFEWPLKETEECAAELARMLNEALAVR